MPLSGFIPTSQRPRYLEIRAVMEQIPEIQKDCLDQFDCKLLNPSLQKVADKRRKDQFKRLIAGCIGVGLTFSLVLPTTFAVASETSCGPAHYGRIIPKVTYYSSPNIGSFSSVFHRNPWASNSGKKFTLRIFPHFSKNQSQCRRQMRWTRRAAWPPSLNPKSSCRASFLNLYCHLFFPCVADL